jgi:hypothetical protein
LSFFFLGAVKLNVVNETKSAIKRNLTVDFAVKTILGAVLIGGTVFALNKAGLAKAAKVIK